MNFVHNGTRWVMIFIGGMAIGTNIGISNIQKPGQYDSVYRWDQVLNAYNAYVACPSEENAKSLRDSLPEDWGNNLIGDANKALHHIFSIDNYPILSQEALTGDRNALEILFRLLNVTDGFYLETIESALGLCIRIWPEKVLEVIYKYRDTEQIRTRGYPISFIGAGHNVHPGAEAYILKKRIKAIETVHDPRYAKIKEGCINQLNKALEKDKELHNFLVW
jgi:hypothetical protein